MRCGLVLSTMYPLGQSSAEAAEDWLAAAEAASRYDFDVLLAGQHFLHDDLQMFQPIPMLARAAAFGGSMRLGTGILLLPLLSPVRVAEDMATLDCLVGGRTVMGVGMGYREHEFEAFGRALADRVGRLTEGLDVIRRLWTEERVTFHGRHFTMTGVASNPKPVQPGGPPVWLAAHADKAVARAARIADAWLISPHSGLAPIARQVEIFRKAAAAAERTPELVLERETHIAETNAIALREAGPHLEEKYKAYLRWGQEGAMAADDRIDMPIDELARDRFLIGGPDSIVAQIEALHARLRMDRMIVHVRRPAMDRATVIAGINLLGREVLPHLARL
jgi:alkanesulfonate monooxygenase SsuD/methylene tetrahydromethanopterin reductase-like flavin-dependent oxidoreductase (luciferase family)